MIKDGEENAPAQTSAPDTGEPDAPNDAALADAQRHVRRINEILSSTFEYQRRRDGDGDVQKLITEAIRSFAALAPRDEVENMLSTQMVATHLAAMECLRRAAIPEQTLAGRQSGLQHAQKLMSLYLRQVETLNKHRGKGRQKITVEHVSVEAGGQAIVGNVNATMKDPTQALTHEPGQTVPVTEDRGQSELEPVPVVHNKAKKRRPKS